MSEHAHEGPVVSPSAFHYRGFVLYWFSRFFNAVSIQIVSVSVGWQIYDQTRDPFLLGLVGLAQFLPSLPLVVLTGAAADRFSRRRIMGLCIASESLCVAALLAVWVLQDPASAAVWPVFAVLTVFGVARAFLGPAVQSLVANLVPREAFANAVAWNSSSWQVAMIGGPMVGGLLYGVSPVAPYVLAMSLFAVSASLTFFIPKPDQRSTSGQERATEALLAGFRFIWSKPVVLGAISLDMFAVMLGGATALLPAMARDVLVVGPVGLGLLRAAPGVGAVLMALWLARNPIRDWAGYVMFIAVGVYGVAASLFGASEMVWLSIIALAIMGAGDMISVYVRATLVQLATPDEVRGRVSAVNMVFIGASNELGEFRAGTMAALIGVVPAIIFGGVGSVLIAILWARMFPDLLNIRRLEGR